MLIGMCVDAGPPPWYVYVRITMLPGGPFESKLSLIEFVRLKFNLEAAPSYWCNALQIQVICKVVEFTVTRTE
jgi:hypothetical protein